MRAIVRGILASLILAAAGAAPAAWAAPTAAPLDTTADQVLGQPGFITSDVNRGGVGLGLNGPQGVTVDAHSGRLYVADNGNNRVLAFNNLAAPNVLADRVFGQPTFVTNTVNNGGLNASGLFGPTGVAVDPAGDVHRGRQRQPPRAGLLQR